MHKTMLGVALCIIGSAISATAQNTFPASGNVGIGTTSPTKTLEVKGLTFLLGGALIGQNTNGTAVIDAYNGDAFFGDNTATNGIAVSSSGSVGIGTTTPTSPLQVVGTFTTVNYGTIPDWGGLVAAGTAASPTAVLSGTTLAQIGVQGYGTTGWTASSAAKILMVAGENFSDTTGAAYMTFNTRASGNTNAAPERMRIDQNGNVGIGTAAPGAKLEVDGGVKLTSGSGGTVTFADGTVQSTAWTGVLCGGDFAESVDVIGERKHYEPGDVLVVDPTSPGSFLKSVKPYSTLVAGIYATKPGMVGRRYTDPKKLKNEIPMAMVGIVPTKVTAENGPIHAGDLLVSSSRLGYAMKGTDRERLTGAVVGKALGPLNAGTGVIEVLVSLQ